MPENEKDSKSEGLSKAAASRLGLRVENGSATLDKQSLLAGMGGWLGIIESLVPGLLFITAFSLTKDAIVSVITASISSVIFIIARVIRKHSVVQAASGAIGVAIAAFLALRPGGEGRDYFISGFFTNAAYFAVLSLSVLVRWPIIGVLVGFLLGEKTEWRKNRYEMRVFGTATLIWAGLFAARLIVQLPLYFANNLDALSVAKLAMGLPLYAAVLWLTWLLVRGVIRRRG